MEVRNTVVFILPISMVTCSWAFRLTSNCVKLNAALWDRKTHPLESEEMQANALHFHPHTSDYNINALKWNIFKLCSGQQFSFWGVLVHPTLLSNEQHTFGRNRIFRLHSILTWVAQALVDSMAGSTLGFYRVAAKCSLWVASFLEGDIQHHHLKDP